MKTYRFPATQLFLVGATLVAAPAAANRPWEVHEPNSQLSIGRLPDPVRYLLEHQSNVQAAGLTNSFGIVNDAGRTEAGLYYLANRHNVFFDPAASLSTLDKWKAHFGFSPRNPGETLEAYRARVTEVVYYNEKELGLGRIMACSFFVDHEIGTNVPLPDPGLACYVTNTGESFGQAFGPGVADDPMDHAIANIHYRNTVVISYQPSLVAAHGEGYGVQFAVYGPDGALAYDAQLDHMGKRFQPGVCMGCHGGSYDLDKHLVKDGKFLPPRMTTFLYADVAPYRRQDQEWGFRAITNAMFYLNQGLSPANSILEPGQVSFLRAQYQMRSDESFATEDSVEAVPVKWRFAPRNPMDPNQPYDPEDTACPAGFTQDQSWCRVSPRTAAFYDTPFGGYKAADLYARVVNPYCEGCHQALKGWSAVTIGWGEWKSLWPAIEAVTFSGGPGKTKYSMPHAQITLKMFWESAVKPSGLRADGTERFKLWSDAQQAFAPNGAELLCFGYECPSAAALTQLAMTGSYMGNNVPVLERCFFHANCGDPLLADGSGSGRMCQVNVWGQTQCLDGCSAQVGCPKNGLNHQECVAPPTGGVGTCVTCGRLDQIACTAGPPCVEGFEANGVCVQCQSNSDCDGTTPICASSGSSAHHCVQCQSDVDCGFTAYCASTNECVERPFGRRAAR